MDNVIEEFGWNAGRVWRALDSRGPLTEDQLMEETNLKPKEISAAIGWLARENKIRQDGDLYKLDETNLTVKIGENAGKIWRLLFAEGELNTRYISEALNMEEKEVQSALGWLAREGKIQIRRTRKNK
jgi:transcription initiation factor IIE alpha subunit